MKIACDVNRCVELREKRVDVTFDVPVLTINNRHLILESQQMFINLCKKHLSGEGNDGNSG